MVPKSSVHARIGAGQDLEFLTVSGTSALNGQAVDTTGIQTYTGAATLHQDTALTGTVVTFHSTVDALASGVHGAAERGGYIRLQAGLHPITVTFFEYDGGEVLSVAVQGPNFAKQAMPANALFCTAPPAPPAPKEPPAPKAK